jgi:Predicted membrane protein
MTFCLVGLIQVIWQLASLFSLLIFLGLLASLPGDYYLVFIKTNKIQFTKGILFFGLTHIFYIIAMMIMSGIHIMEFLITGVLVLPFLLLLNLKKIHLGKMKKIIFLYFVLVTFMAVKAFLLFIEENHPLTEQGMFTCGAVLFLISDLLLGLWNYLIPKKLFYYIVHICYFTGQLMIVTAAYYQ